MTTEFAVFALFLMLMVSCPLAHAASGHREGMWGWGFLGPIGWIIAGICGAQARLDDIADRLPPPR